MRVKSNIRISLLVVAVVIAVVIPNSKAGNLQPSAPPAPTMKTLDEIPPSWSQKLPESTRYSLALNNDGVLDKETGLVWQQTPRTTLRNWNNAIQRCYDTGTGGRAGWRLPTVSEMASLFHWAASRPLSFVHPFSVPDLNNCAGTICQFWTSTSAEGDASRAYTVRIEVTSDTWNAARPEDKTSSFRYWCVRGGSGHMDQ